MLALRTSQAGLPLRRVTLPVPQAERGQVLLKVRACGVCRTDLHLVDGELPGCRHPVTPGHEVVAEVVEGGGRLRVGERVGVPWLGWTCGVCAYCRRGQENLCPQARFTGCHFDGGYAEYLLADERFCLPIPAGYGDAEAAPLLCAGLIGYRCYRKIEDVKSVGLYGFGAAAHILSQVARAEGRTVFAFTRDGDAKGQAFARACGANWAGGAGEPAPEPLDAAIVFAPVGALVPKALADVRKGGRVVCGGIHMSDIPSFPYALLWGERRVESVANLTREDGDRFMALAGRLPIRTSVRRYRLEAAAQALEDLRAGMLEGAAVLMP